MYVYVYNIMGILLLLMGINLSSADGHFPSHYSPRRVFMCGQQRDVHRRKGHVTRCEGRRPREGGTGGDGDIDKRTETHR